MHIPAFYFSPVPASVTHDPSAFALSIFGLLGSNLIALEWLRQIGKRCVRYPHPIKHPVSLYRITDMLVMIGILMRSGPDTMQFTLWPDIAPATRFGIAHWNRILDGASFLPFVIAFALAMTTAHLDEVQIGREPIPINLWPKREEKRRFLVAMLLLLFISIAIAYK